MGFDFDRIIDRRASDSVKWRAYDADILPLWVADMDFAAPPPVLTALHAAVEHGVLGYGLEPADLREIIVAWLARRFGWCVAAEALVIIPGVVTGFNIACRMLRAGEGVLTPTPVYGPMLEAPALHGLIRQDVLLTPDAAGRYALTTAAMAQATDERTRLLMLCNPQNPTGRVFTRAELAEMAEFCAAHDLVICSDEIHGDLVFQPHRHIPIATLDAATAARTITLMAPSKTFNIPGLGFSLAIIEDEALRTRFERALAGLIPHVNVLGYAAARAAYAEGDAWLDACLAYLAENRTLLADRLATQLAPLGWTPPEATYLAWLDCRAAALPQRPDAFFLEQARVAVNAGDWFGPGGEGFVRLNFACPRATLAQALDRMAAALAGRNSKFERAAAGGGSGWGPCQLQP